VTREKFVQFVVRQIVRPAAWVSVIAGFRVLPAPTEAELERGLIVLFPGVEGGGWVMGACAGGLRDAGWDGALRVIAWGRRPLGTFHNLMMLETNRAQARTIAAEITTYRRAHPNAPLSLVGLSGGAGMCLFIAEALPEDVMLDRILLIAPALSPTYHPGPAAARCRRGIVSFYSDLDWLMLGVGTTTFGTIDRRFGTAAGKVGFRDAAGQLRSDPWLTQIHWNEEWLRAGHYGGHLGGLCRRWARDILAPHVVPPRTPAQ
jgi:hypothetical protein